MRTGETVAEFGTRLVRTRVGDLGQGRFVWQRRAGAGRGSELVVPSAGVRSAIGAADTPGVRFVLPYDAGDGSLLYAMPGAFSAARLLRGSEPRLGELLRAALHGTGVALRRLHATPTPDGLPDLPPGLVRLMGWLDGGRGELAAAGRERLGDTRWARAREWCAAAGGDGAGVLLHGAVSLGVLVPSPRPGVAGLASGEDVARGAGSLDVGWMLGELVELEAAARRGLGTAPHADYAGLTAALLEGYGVPEADPAMRRAAALRVLTHAHDYATFVAWHDDLLAYLDLVADLLDA